MQNNYWNGSDLERINFTISEPGAIRLSPLARAYLRLFVVMVRLKAVGIAAPIACITSAQLRAGGRYRSERSTFRALAELETAGYLHRSKYRLGADRFRTVITFHLEAFAYFTQQKAENITPFPYIPPQLPSCQGEALTISASRSYSCDLAYLKRAIPARATNKQKGIYKWIAVINTIRVLLGSPRHPAVILSQSELDGTAENISGIDWHFWRTRWDDMTIPIRETTAKRELLPPLLRALRRNPSPTPSPAPVSAPKPEPATISPPPPSPTHSPEPEQIRAAIREIAARATIPTPTPPPAARGPCELTAEQWAFLETARLKTIARAR